MSVEQIVEIVLKQAPSLNEKEIVQYINQAIKEIASTTNVFQKTDEVGTFPYNLATKNYLVFDGIVCQEGYKYRIYKDQVYLYDPDGVAVTTITPAVEVSYSYIPNDVIFTDKVTDISYPMQYLDVLISNVLKNTLQQAGNLETSLYYAKNYNYGVSRIKKEMLNDKTTSTIVDHPMT